MGKQILIVLFFGILTLISAAQDSRQSPPPAHGSPSPADYSGMYSFLRDGEFVQITIEDQGKLTGFISRYGDLDSDRGAFLDQFFKTGAITGNDLAFTTEQVHGVWFEFKGTADRGAGKTPNDEAYYELKGDLTEHSNDADGHSTARSRQVVFKSFPQDVAAPSGRSKD